MSIKEKDRFFISFKDQTITHTCKIYDYIQLSCDDISISIYNKYVILLDKFELNLFDIHNKKIKKIEIDEINQFFIIHIYDNIVLKVDISDEAYTTPEAINIVLSENEVMVF